MKEELRKLLLEFVEDVDDHNDARRRGEYLHLVFEEDAKITLENFIKWLNF